MLNVYTKCQKYRQQAESRYRRRAAFFMAIADTRLKDEPEGNALANIESSGVHGWTIPLEIDADERIGTATCGAWSSRVSVTRPPQSPCDAQTCHYHATLSTMGSTRTCTHTGGRVVRVYVNVCPVPRTIKPRDPADHKEHTSRASGLRGCRLVDHLLVAVHTDTPPSLCPSR